MTQGTPDRLALDKRIQTPVQIHQVNKNWHWTHSQQSTDANDTDPPHVAVAYVLKICLSMDYIWAVELF
jgi:hypothetical protein